MSASNRHATRQRGAELLASFRAEEDPAVDVEDRLWNRLALSMTGAPFAGEGDGDGGGEGIDVDAPDILETPLGALDLDGGGTQRAVDAGGDAPGPETMGAGTKAGSGGLMKAGLGLVGVTVAVGAYLVLQAPSDPSARTQQRDELVAVPSPVDVELERVVHGPTSEPLLAPTEPEPEPPLAVGSTPPAKAVDLAPVERTRKSKSTRGARARARSRSADESARHDVPDPVDHELGAQVRSLSAIESELRHGRFEQADQLLHEFGRRYPKSEFSDVTDALRAISHCQRGDPNAPERARELLGRASTRKFASRLRRACRLEKP